MVTLYRIAAQLGIRICVVTILSLIAITPIFAAEFRAVAVTGQQAPGAEAGVLFESLWGNGNFPRFNAAGHVLLPAGLTGTGVNDDNDGGLWVVDTSMSAYSLIARQGDQAPGAAAGVTFGTRAFVDGAHYDGYMGQLMSAFSDAGEFAYWADLAGPGVDATNDSGIWTGNASSGMQLLARAGDQAAGMPSDVVYTNLLRYEPAINLNGQVVVNGRVGGPGVTPTKDEDALWTGTSAGLSLVVRQGDTAPGTTEKFALHKYGGFRALIDNSGELQIESLLSADGVFAVNSNAGLWTGTSGANLELFAHKNDPAPGLGAGVVMTRNFHRRPVTSSGKFVFDTQISGSGVTRFLDSGTVWAGSTTGELSLVARQNDPSLPGSGGNLTFEVFDDPVMNESGTFLFATQWDHIDSNSIYVNGIHRGTSAEDLELVVGGDQPIPGLDSNLRISGVSDLSINNAGQFFFLASIRDSDPFSMAAHEDAIFGYDPAQGVQKLLQAGDLLEVVPGEWRTIQGFSGSDSGSILEDGLPRGLTDDGQFLVRAYFTDGGHGVLVGNLATAVPEPSSLLLAGLAAVGLMVKRRRKGAARPSVRKIGLSAGLGLLMIAPAAAAEFDVVAVTGQQAPGAGVGVLFKRVWGELGTSHLPRFNAEGQVLLPAELTGTGVNDANDGGLWVIDTENSTSSLIARQGDQAPGAAAGVTFGTRAFVGRVHYDGYMGQDTNAFNDAGRFVYWADLTGPGVDATNDSGLWTGTTSADMELLVRTGDQAAGMPSGVVYANLLRSRTVINSSGRIVISGRVAGPGVTPFMNDDALWSGTPAELSLEVRQGNPAPGTTEKFALHKYGGFSTLINDSGDLQIQSLLSADGVFAVNSHGGLWTGTSGADLELFAHKNDPAPGLGAGVVFSKSPFRRPITSSGQFIFRTHISGPRVTPFQDSGTVWVGSTAGDLSLIARQGDPSLPGSGGNLTYEVFDWPKMNESGTFVFTTQWDHVDTDSIYVHGIHMGTSADDLELVVGGDQSIPGLDLDLRLRTISDLSINNAGQFIFYAGIGDTDPTNNSSGASSIFGYDPIHGVQQFVQSGEQLEVAPGDMRTVNRLYLDAGSSLADGTPRNLTEDGRFLFRTIFTDGSEGLFVGSFATAVPEPGSLALITCGLILVFARRRQHFQ